MSERLPYEEIDRQFNDLPMPDEEASWQKMKERLDKGDYDGTILPPVLLPSCMGWGLLLLAGLVVAWLVVRPDRWRAETRKPETSSTSKNGNKKSNLEGANQQPNVIHGDSSSVSGTHILGGEKDKINSNSIQAYEIVSGNKRLPSKTFIQKSEALGAKPGKTIVQKSVSDGISKGNVSNGIRNNKVTDQGKKGRKTDTSHVNKQEASLPIDSLKKADLPQQSDASLQKTNATQKKLIVAAGVGLQQLIPIAGQTLVPYSYYGRDGSIADYIPSLYLQLHKKGKWFIMGEFRFGAAQSVKEFSYNRKTRYDTSTMNTTVTTMRLKKTYYHQLPFSFNYYLLPNLSFGVGGMYSRFYGAVTEKETDTWNSLTQKYTNVKQIIPMKHFSDSFLFKTQVHVLLQADYQWKRFSFGLRYTRDIQPYIEYTKPDGTVDEKRNESLQLMVHYRIWQSAKL